MKKTTSRISSIVTALALTACMLTTMNSKAEELNPYESEFNLTECINYAIKWADKRNMEYKTNKWAKANCASYVSECLGAGGLKLPEAYRECSGIEIAEKLCLSGYIYSNQEWSVASKQFTYLTTKLGYCYEEAQDDNIHVGDVLYYDWRDRDVDIDHAAICIGISDNGKPYISEHSGSGIRAWDKTKSSSIERVFVVHTTNTMDLTDVTAEYYDKNINIDAMKSGNPGFLNPGEPYFVSPNNSHSYRVCKDKCLDYANLKLTYPVSFKSKKNNYLSAFITEKDAPIKSTSNNSTWEAFRIYRSGDKEFLQSLENGFFVHIQDDGKAYAHGKLPSTWETFDIKY